MQGQARVTNVRKRCVHTAPLRAHEPSQEYVTPITSWPQIGIYWLFCWNLAPDVTMLARNGELILFLEPPSALPTFGLGMVRGGASCHTFLPKHRACLWPVTSRADRDIFRDKVSGIGRGWMDGC